MSDGRRYSKPTQELVDEFRAALVAARLVGHPNAVYWTEAWAERIANSESELFIRASTANIRRQIKDHLTRINN